jgi:uncharacterized membrane protein HdeD (DUF308 family)
MLNQSAVATSQDRWLVFLVQWVLASAIFDLILAAIILAGSSGAARWALGLLIAINLTLGGLALIVMARTPTAFRPSVRPLNNR